MNAARVLEQMDGAQTASVAASSSSSSPSFHDAFNRAYDSVGMEDEGLLRQGICSALAIQKVIAAADFW